MNSGFIYLHRKLKDHWIWKNPYYFQWFVYLLFRANFKENKILIGSELITIQRGEFITSIDKLCKDLNGSTAMKIRTFLKLLENDSMIVKKSTSKLTKIIICNYDSYQGEQQTNNKPITNQQQTNNKPITTENNVKEEKRIINKNKEYQNWFSENLKSVYLEFLKYRIEIKKKITPSQEIRFIEKLKKLSNSNSEVAEKILIQSIENGWQGIFDIKLNNKIDTNKITSDSVCQNPEKYPNRLKFER